MLDHATESRRRALAAYQDSNRRDRVALLVLVAAVAFFALAALVMIAAIGGDQAPTTAGVGR